MLQVKNKYFLDRVEYQNGLFKNRLKKQYKHLKKWAKRSGIFAYRIYDRDIPEIPLAAEIYFPCNELKEPIGSAYLNLSLYKRPYDVEETDELFWLNSMACAASEVLDIPSENIFIKMREKQKGKKQYEKQSLKRCTFMINEGGCLFIVNISDYLDTGIFLDHRPLRQRIAKEACGKKVLNLFCYTGAFSVNALKGNAVSVDSVDLSKNYLSWAFDNAKLNGFNSDKAFFHHADVRQFLKKKIAEECRWDIIICDPPTFSNSKKNSDFLDINRDWCELCILCLGVLDKNGVLYFSSNSSKLKFDIESLNILYGTNLVIEDLTEASIPPDFRNKKIHRLWSIKNVR